MPSISPAGPAPAQSSQPLALPALCALCMTHPAAVRRQLHCGRSNEPSGGEFPRAAPRDAQAGRGTGSPTGFWCHLNTSHALASLSPAARPAFRSLPLFSLPASDRLGNHPLRVLHRVSAPETVSHLDHRDPLMPAACRERVALTAAGLFSSPRIRALFSALLPRPSRPVLVPTPAPHNRRQNV